MFSHNKMQKLDDIELIPGEYKVININAISQNGIDRSLVNFTPKLDVYMYGYRETPIKTVSGVKSDVNKCSFTLATQDTIGWSGKLEYIITLAYQNGNEVKGMGYITMK